MNIIQTIILQKKKYFFFSYYSYIKVILNDLFWIKVMLTSNVKLQDCYKNVQFLNIWLKFYKY